MLEAEGPWVQILTLPPSGCMTLGKCDNDPRSQFSYMGTLVALSYRVVITRIASS